MDTGRAASTSRYERESLISGFEISLRFTLFQGYTCVCIYTYAWFDCCSEGKGRRFGKLAGDNGRIDVEYRWIFLNFYNYGFERFGRYDF